MADDKDQDLQMALARFRKAGERNIARFLRPQFAWDAIAAALDLDGVAPPAGPPRLFSVRDGLALATRKKFLAVGISEAGAGAIAESVCGYVADRMLNPQLVAQQTLVEAYPQPDGSTLAVLSIHYPGMPPEFGRNPVPLCRLKGKKWVKPLGDEREGMAPKLALDLDAHLVETARLLGLRAASGDRHAIAAAMKALSHDA